MEPRRTSSFAKEIRRPRRGRDPSLSLYTRGLPRVCYPPALYLSYLSLPRELKWPLVILLFAFRPLFSLFLIFFSPRSSSSTAARAFASSNGGNEVCDSSSPVARVVARAPWHRDRADSLDSVSVHPLTEISNNQS